ncbi:hypothetical protein XVE_4739 [Xanthomonas vesicatoria ATCC 35937]|uniref:Uncharacterized protein n=1 Tax=Xanthomonas vesicatoria ATCC 35937 TaxID=925775 RepID=F0BKC5_9XANT|nr:hypothetical protein XVE_4739 [Xanthomonas vesicatoria ATCC 35937]
MRLIDDVPDFSTVQARHHQGDDLQPGAGGHQTAVRWATEIA